MVTLNHWPQVQWARFWSPRPATRTATGTPTATVTKPATGKARGRPRGHALGSERSREAWNAESRRLGFGRELDPFLDVDLSYPGSLAMQPIMGYMRERKSNYAKNKVLVFTPCACRFLFWGASSRKTSEWSGTSLIPHRVQISNNAGILRTTA